MGRLLRRCFALREEMDDAGWFPTRAFSTRCWRRAAAPPPPRISPRMPCPRRSLWEMETSRSTCDAYTCAFITACIAGMRIARWSLRGSGRVKRTAAVFAAAIHACGSTSDGADLPAALAIWEDMRAESVEADAMLYATLMDVSGRAGERAVTERVMFEMERDGVAPTGEVFATLAGIAARDGDVAGVEKVLEEIGARGSAPPRDVFNALIAAAARRGDVDAADDAEVRLRAAGLSGIPRRTKISSEPPPRRIARNWRGSTTSARWISAWRSRFPSSTRSWWRAVARVCCNALSTPST